MKVPATRPSRATDSRAISTQQGRHVSIVDRSLAKPATSARKADRSDQNHIGASMPGKVIAVSCAPGQAVQEGQPLLTLEAMKMETVVRAPRAGKVVEVLCKVKSSVQAGDLLVVFG